MSPEGWQAFVHPDPARDLALAAESSTTVLPWWVWTLASLIWIVALWWAVTAGRWPRARTWRRWEARLVWPSLALGCYAVGNTWGLMETEFQVHAARVAAASAERAAEPVTMLAERMTYNERIVNDHQIWLRELQASVDALRRQQRLERRDAPVAEASPPASTPR